MPMSKEDKEKIGSLSQQEITEKLKKGEIALPPVSDRNEFFTFVAKSPEERAKEINGDAGQSGPYAHAHARRGRPGRRPAEPADAG